LAQSVELTAEVRAVIARNTVSAEDGWVLIKGTLAPDPMVLDTGLSDLAWQRAIEAVARHLQHSDPASSAARFMLNLTRERSHAAG